MAKWKTFYFLGIGGIGMSALARYFVHLDKQVLGYDKTPTGLISNLKKLGIIVNFEDSIAAIDESKINPQDTMVVYTPAIPKDSIQLEYFREHGFTMLKRSEILGLITRNTTCFAVAGTHGKTTTSAILGHLLYECNVAMTAFLGGISKNYNSNFIYKGNEVTVVEADEYDRSFLTLSPDFACITSMDADHLDIYGDHQHLVESFEDFSRCLKLNGKMFVKTGLPIEGITYGVEDHSDYSATDVKIIHGTYHFNLETPSGLYKNFQFNLPGRHNLSNAIIALAMTVEYGCPLEQLAKALASFKGVERRFNYHIKTNDLVYIDDYAHHPTEINAVHNAIKEMFPDKKNVVVFQPHLFSRTKDFADDFAKELSNFDAVLLLEIYPAREKAMLGITSEWLMGKIQNPNKKLINKDDIVKEIKSLNPNIIVTLGAGDIGEEINAIKEGLIHED